MAIIVGTGSNATIPLCLSSLHPSKRPAHLIQPPNSDSSKSSEDVKIAVNTEWSINGSAPPLHELGLITHWDKVLDSEGEAPGFQPFEYMTSGRYLGELGRLIVVDYFTNHHLIPETNLPPKLRRRHGLTTAFLGNLGPHLSHLEPSMLEQLEAELPPDEEGGWEWTEETANVLYQIGKAIQVRGSGMTAAAVIGLLACADEINLSTSPSNQSLPNGMVPATTKRNNPIVEGEEEKNKQELMVGYTGGCIVHFQNYLHDCQSFLDQIMERDFSHSGFDEEVKKTRVVLRPCHDGGIIGAGILAGTVRNVKRDS
jgi:hypothetical protein